MINSRPRVYFSSFIYFSLLLLCLVTHASPSEASTQGKAGDAEVAVLQTAPVTGYRYVGVVPIWNGKVPAVLEVPIDAGIVGRFGKTQAMDVLTNTETASYLREYVTKQSLLLDVRAQVNGRVVQGEALTDAQADTWMDFSIENGKSFGQAVIDLEAPADFRADTFTVVTDARSSSVTSIGITTIDTQGDLQTVRVPRDEKTSQVSFPETEAKRWRVTISYDQPVRVLELEFRSKQIRVPIRTDIQYGVRFLAIPGHSYQIFAGANETIRIDWRESGRLDQDAGVVKMSPISFDPNTNYIESDRDFDRVEDFLDNCPDVPNVNQTDIDGNLIGDDCEDFDRDGVLNHEDNCVDTANRNQDDEDKDGIGDACDFEESRFTEKHAWVPWAGIGIAVLVIGVLFALTIRHIPKEPQEPTIIE